MGRGTDWGMRRAAKWCGMVQAPVVVWSTVGVSQMAEEMVTLGERFTPGPHSDLLCVDALIRHLSRKYSLVQSWRAGQWGTKSNG